VHPTVEDFLAARGAALLRFAVMLTGHRPAAEDLLQSTLGRAYPRWSRIAAMEQPEAYLKKMLTNEHLRWRARRSSAELPIAEPPDGGVVASPADHHASRDAAWALLGRLPRRQRAVLVLRYYEDLTDAEIASVLGCRESTVRSQAARGIAALRLAVPELNRELLP
jgi:RNA polymerase sigma-70 factor (sigma-E family)